jgi:transposase
MGAPLSMDLRQRVVRAVEEGASRRAAAARFKVAPRTAVRWVGDYRSSGSVASQKMGNPSPPKLGALEGGVAAEGALCHRQARG